MKKQLDIGCSGFTRTWDGYDCWGVDIVDHRGEADAKQIVKADLAIEPIPFPDNEFDLVTAYDFLEHLPQVLYLPDWSAFPKFKSSFGTIRRDVMIELFNEIYRVMKPNGIFYSQTPIYPDKSVFQDPTHLSVWTDDSMNYFSGDYFGFHDHYGHKSRFEQVQKRVENNHLFISLKAKKDIASGTQYQVHY